METVHGNGNPPRLGGLKKPQCSPLGMVESKVLGIRKTQTDRARVENDPYKELELYFDKVNEEIGEILESVPIPPPRFHGIYNYPDESYRAATSTPNGVSNRIKQFERRNRREHDPYDWSENFLDEFNSIIAREINELNKIGYESRQRKIESRKVDYQGLLDEFGITDSNFYNIGCVKRDNSYCNEENERKNGPDVHPCLNSDYDEPSDRLVHNSMKSSNSLHSINYNSDYDEPNNSLATGSCSSLPNEFHLPKNNSNATSSNNSHISKHNNHPFNSRNNSTNVSDEADSGVVVLRRQIKNYQPSTDPMPRSNRMLKALADLNLNDVDDKLPPQPGVEPKRKLLNLPLSYRKGIFGKTRKSIKEVNLKEEHDYDEIAETDPSSLELKSAPVTPTDRNMAPFPRLMKKRHAPIYHGMEDHAVLMRVSSLPEEDLKNLPNGKLRNGHCSVAKAPSLPMRSGKRLAESDKDVARQSPVEIKRFNFDSREHKINVQAEIHRQDESVTISNEGRDVKSSSLPMTLQSFLSKFNGGSSTSCSSSSPPGKDNDFCFTDMGTQTSPAISRSSSFTWVSDCDIPQDLNTELRKLRDGTVVNPASPQNTVDDDNRSSSSSQELLQSMDEISSGSLSPDNIIDRSSPMESGIGTASPPRSTERRMTKQSQSLEPEKSLQAENWDRVRRRNKHVNLQTPDKSTAEEDVWIKRESVHTQTKIKYCQHSNETMDSSSGMDDTLSKEKSSRPNNLPLGLSTAISSSLSSGELLGTLIHGPSSPSTVSLKLKNEPLTLELPSKSNSAPLLDNKNAEKTANLNKEHHQPRSQSERHISEIEAQEACKWLRAAGFPQYAQMYEDCQFPIDINSVAKDHPFLDTDSLQSLYRRLQALNRCANMKLDSHHHHHHHSYQDTSHKKTTSKRGDDSDEDTECALSENWTYEKKTRRWSRIGEQLTPTPQQLERLQTIAAASRRFGIVDDEDTIEFDESTEDVMLDALQYRSLPPGAGDDAAPRFRRTGSERLRDGAKAFLRRMESLKSRKRKQYKEEQQKSDQQQQQEKPQAQPRAREGLVISSPQLVDIRTMQQRMRGMNCVDVSPTDGSPSMTLAVTVPTSPYHPPASPSGVCTTSPFGDDSSSYCSDGSQGGGPSPSPAPVQKSKLSKTKRFLSKGPREDTGALSDSECQPTSWRHRYFKDANSNDTKVLEYVTSSPKEYSTKSCPMATLVTHTVAIAGRGGSLNLGNDTRRYRDKYSTLGAEKSATSKNQQQLHKAVFREGGEAQDVTIYRADKSRTLDSRRDACPDVSGDLPHSQESSSTGVNRDSDPDEDSAPKKGVAVVRWHSFQRGSLVPEPMDPLCSRAMASMSCGQLLVLRKLSLLKLTACMERFCPTHRSGWNWELPKFIRKIKTPDYKDKTVFGVPLLLSLQRTGQSLPKCIQIALRWLRANALDQVGLFRKSGVRSRIQHLKDMTEAQGENVNFDSQSVFDVADLVKQYFRELPEALLTNKLSETFIAIFQHVPQELRSDAVQCVLLLLPDEHREALETLLDFLSHVASNSFYNQMTASNLAVCLAPSLFHFNHSNTSTANRSNSVSPRRRKTVGAPDQRELAENKAAHDCLLHLIKMHRELFMISSDMLSQCHFNYMEESVPVPLEKLGTELKQDWKGYMLACITALLKEGREKSRGWEGVNNIADSSVDVAYKKVGDGHPLRLWRVITEVEAPPEELLHRVLRERHIWDHQLLMSRQVAKLDVNSEVFQYSIGNMTPLPTRDYCVLRCWQSDLPKKACVIVETSVEHPDAPIMFGGTRGIVLASRYLIEHCGSGKSRIMHLSRVDTKGRTTEWYNKSYGHIAALHLSKIRNSFKHTATGPESKV